MMGVVGRVAVTIHGSSNKLMSLEAYNSDINFHCYLANVIVTGTVA